MRGFAEVGKGNFRAKVEGRALIEDLYTDPRFGPSADLRMSLEGVTGNSHACLLDGPGFTAVPNIEAEVIQATDAGEVAS